METTTFENPLNTFGNPPPGEGTADSAARKVKPSIDQVAAMAHRAVDKAAKSAAPAVDWIGETGESLSATQKKLVSDTSAYIAANPLMSVGIAVLAGFVISRMVRS